MPEQQDPWPPWWQPWWSETDTARERHSTNESGSTMAKLADALKKPAPAATEDDPGVEALAQDALVAESLTSKQRLGNGEGDAEEAPKAVPAPETASGAVEARAGAKAPKKAAGTPKAGGRVKLGSLTSIDEKVNICYYGPEGTGKTTDVAHMAHLGRVLFINAESGLIGRRLAKLGVPIENVVVWPDPDSGDKVSYEGLDQLFWNLKGDLLEDAGSWAGVVWDSATEILNAVLEDVVAAQVAKAERAGKDRDPFFTDLADYGTMTAQMRQLLRRYRDLPCHFAITALERRDTDDDGKVLYGPAVTPALISDIAGFVGIVVHTEVSEYGDDVVYAGRTRPGTKYRAKDRFGLLPALMATPTFDRIVGYVNETIEPESDPEQQAARKRAADAKAAEEERRAAGGKRTSRS